MDVCSFPSKKQKCTVASPVASIAVKTSIDPFPGLDPILPDPEPEISIEPERQLHLAFLFAGPLVTAYKDEDQIRLKSMPILEYRKEIEEIVSNASNYHQAIKYKKCVATIDNLQQCINEMPVALHFAGHGMKNTAFAADKVCDGDFLVFEDENGKAQYVSCQLLKKILRTYSNRQPEFVFVSSCHSRLVGDVFKSAGARHVICVKRSEKVLDEVAILFAQEFYKAYFSPNGTVCTAFEVARTNVKTKTAEHIDHSPFLNQGDEYTKFELLIGGEYSLPHNCSNPYPIPIGEPKDMNAPVTYSDIPSKVEYFVGRKVELHNLICLIRNSRIVTIKGLAGIGKTSMAKFLAHFFMERGTFNDGIIYISTIEVKSTDKFITQLYMDAKCKDGIEKNRVERILSALENKEVLLIIDNAEDLLNHDRFKFLSLIHTLLSKLPKLKTLITSRTHLGSLPDLTEKVYNLLPLDSKNSVLLLERRAPRQISSGEIDELFHERIASERLNGSNPNFEEHRLMRLLAGHPQAISLAAASLQGRTLKETYQELIPSPLRINEMLSLRTSLSLSIEHVKMRNPSSVKFFKMMGLFPCGVSSREIAKIWGNQYKEHIANLQYVSLLVRKESGNIQEDRYWLLPFVADYGLNCIKDYDINDLIESGCKFYGNKLEAIFMAEVNIHGYLLKDEHNIMAFIMNGSGETVKEDPENLLGLRFSNNQVLEPIIESDTKELIPTRDAVEMLDTEESKIVVLASHTRVRQMTVRRNSSLIRRNSGPKVKRRNSECLHCTSLVEFIEHIKRRDTLDEPEDEKYGVNVNEQYEYKITTKKEPIEFEEGMSSYGKLIVYYCAVLFLSKRYKDVNKIIGNYIDSPNLTSDTLAQANLYKLLGLSAEKLQEANAEKYYNIAKTLFAKVDSYLGQAACLIALGEIEKSKNNYTDTKYSYENALRCYTLIKHAYGMMHCNKEIMKLKLILKYECISNEPLLEKETVDIKKSKKYVGGVFVNRWEAKATNFVIEVAKVSNGIFLSLALEFIACNKVMSSVYRNYKSNPLWNKDEIYDDIEQSLKRDKGKQTEELKKPLEFNILNKTYPKKPNKKNKKVPKAKAEIKVKEKAKEDNTLN